MYVLHELSKHKLAYFLLCLILGLGIAAYLFWGETTLHQQIVIVALSCSYFLWGILTHLKSEHITRYVIQEYAGIAVLGGLLLLLLTF